MKPWSVQVELAEGCNRLCSFCGLNGIRTAPGGYRFMTRETAVRVASQLAAFCPEARYEFAMHGEPTMNPKHLDLIQVFRRNLMLAQMQLTTNGKTMLGRMQGQVEAVFAAGVDFIILDTYEPERGALQREARRLTGIKVLDFYEDCLPGGISPWHNHRRRLNRTVILMDDIGERDGEVRSRTIFNHAGSNPGKPVPAEPLKKTCTNPFRELAINWDGTVNLCCMDWKGEYRVGDLTRETAEAVWTSELFEAARAILGQKRRDFGPCARCDVGSGSRAGLLPKYPKPTDEQVSRARGNTRIRVVEPRG